MQPWVLTFAFLSAATASALGIQPSPAASATFDHYVASVEARLNEQHQTRKQFLQLSGIDLGTLREAEPRIEEIASGKKVPGGLLHHWRGTLFVPGARIPDFLALMQDGKHLSTYFGPQVERSRLLGREGDRLQLEMRLRYRKVITVVLDTRYDVQYAKLDHDHGYSLSRSTQISEIADAGDRDERVVKPADEHGFLWRLNTYWTYVQEPDGLLLQCEAASLTRDIPFGLDWVVGPFVKSIPRESLEFTLNATRSALLSRRNHGH